MKTAEKKINLEEIMNGIVPLGAMQHKAKIKDAMKEACKQALELAAEKIKSDAMEDFGSEVPDCWNDQSILDTINLIE